MDDPIALRDDLAEIILDNIFSVESRLDPPTPVNTWFGYSRVGDPVTRYIVYVSIAEGHRLDRANYQLIQNWAHSGGRNKVDIGRLRGVFPLACDMSMNVHRFEPTFRIELSVDYIEPPTSVDDMMCWEDGYVAPFLKKEKKKENHFKDDLFEI